MAPAVEIRGLTKAFGSGETRTLALRGVDLSVNAGEITFLVGQSGCGKTTLITAIAGMLTPDDGDIHVFGRDIGAMSTRALTRFRGQTTGFIFQQFNLLPALTATENVAVPLLIAGRPQAAANTAALHLLDRLGLGPHATKLPAQLSGGQQQRVAIARALAMDPDLVLADEPTGNLDSKSADAVFDLMRQINRERGTTFLIVTHNIELAKRCDRIVEVVDGRVPGFSCM